MDLTLAALWRDPARRRDRTCPGPGGGARPTRLAALGGWHQLQFGWSITSPVVGYPLAVAMLPVAASMVALTVLALIQLVNVWRRQPPEHIAEANVTAD